MQGCMHVCTYLYIHIFFSALHRSSQRLFGVLVLSVFFAFVRNVCSNIVRGHFVFTFFGWLPHNLAFVLRLCMFSPRTETKGGQTQKKHLAFVLHLLQQGDRFSQMSSTWVPQTGKQTNTNKKTSQHLLGPLSIYVYICFSIAVVLHALDISRA